MVNEAARLGRGDIAVQASCSGYNPTYDTEKDTFTELLLWKLEGSKIVRWRDERICDIETALLNFGPCYYCPDRRKYRGWIFVDEDGSDQGSQCFSLESDSSDMPTPVPDNNVFTRRFRGIRIQPPVVSRFRKFMKLVGEVAWRLCC
mmetsp:Transcript_65420/g.104102  ORF Transcript_65420/g.104102 Transcript_65420/m.104102 type:complete len:147 (+) Transcript_65420:1-441(+)